MSVNRTPLPKFGYRRDIDGLRAVAVLLVVLFHVRTRVLGGYIGVDVFFVISGYLISSTILAEMSAGNFSIINFYERRIRRILPALLGMIIITTALALHYLAPSDMEAYGRSVLAALFSVSNFLFARQVGYFDGASGLQPLLHTWSLAVEEQFYILFPVTLVIVRKLAPNQLKTTIWSLTAVSFILACWWVHRDPTFAFFVAPLRAWELLIGTIISQRYLPAINGKLARNLASLLGILLIVAAGFLYNSGTAFPGLSALPPCLGAALIIAAGETGSSVVGRILSLRPFVFIGLISYSLYLWHWPLLVLQTTNFVFADRPGDSKLPRAIVFFVSLIVATLSWRFVEMPFRKGFLRPSRRMLFQITGIATVLMAIVGLVAVISHGLPMRFSALETEIGSYISYEPTAEWREHTCFLLQNENFEGFAHSGCLMDEPQRKHYLLLGDSLGAQLYPGLVTVFPEINFSQATVAGCRPLLPSGGSNQDAGLNCAKMRKFIFADYLKRRPVSTVLLSGDWRDDDLPALAQTISWIQQNGMQVILFGRTSMYDQSLPRLLFVSVREGNSKYLVNHFQYGERQLDRQWALSARDKLKVPYISVYDNLCSVPNVSSNDRVSQTINGCPLYAEPGVPLLFDKHHLTVQASRLYARSIKAHNQLPE